MRASAPIPTPNRTRGAVNCGHDSGEAAPFTVEAKPIQQKGTSICHFEDIRQRFLLPKDIQNSRMQAVLRKLRQKIIGRTPAFVKSTSITISGPNYHVFRHYYGVPSLESNWISQIFMVNTSAIKHIRNHYLTVQNVIFSLSRHQLEID